MHERSLINALLRHVEEVAAKHPGSHVQAIRVRVGAFSGVEPELLASAYNDLIDDSPLRGALDMKQVPLEGLCDQCGNRFRIERFDFQCNQCGSLRVTLCGGEEMLLDSITMEESEP